MDTRILGQLVQELSTDRPIFHSEADFQHSLAWLLHQRWPSAAVRLEKPFSALSRTMHLDVLFIDSSKRFGIELKYKTRALETVWRGEQYKLKNQAAQDLGRYDFLLDVQRIEFLTSEGLIERGASVFLTNDSAYWKTPGRSNTVDAEFRLHGGRSVAGSLRWGPKASSGTTKGREGPISLRRTYDLEWRDYSEFPDGPYQAFKYLIVG